MQEFTLEELKKYNGKNGNPAYIAVNGKVYDVTNNSHWKNGEHHGYEAGNDLTEPLTTNHLTEIKFYQRSSK